MARSEARLSVEIWEDKDFLDLSPLAQRAYMFLLSQPDLAHTGVIPLRGRRWSRKAAGLTAADLQAHLGELEDAWFLVIDWDTEEVLVRSFMRRDRVYRQPNVMRAAVDHVPLVESREILRTLVAEVDRIRAENPELTAQQSEALREMENVLLERVGADGEPSPERPTRNPTENPSGNPSEHPSGNATPATPGERGGSRAVQEIQTLPVPRTNPPPAGDAVALAAPTRALALVADEAFAVTNPQNTQELIAYWLERCNERPPGDVIGQLSKLVKRMVDKDHIAPQHIAAGIDDFLSKDVHPSVLPSLVNNAMNRRPRASPQQTPVTERKFAANQQVAEALRAREGQP